MYYIPDLRSNIISLGQLSEEGNRVTLKGEFMWVYDEEGKLLMKVKRSPNRLYKLIIENDKLECFMTSAEENSKMWHARLGHVNYQAIAMLFKER